MTSRSQTRRLAVQLQSEVDIQRACLLALKALRIPAWRNNVDRRGRVKAGVAGQADITGILPHSGKRLEIELKRPGGKQSDAQIEFQRMVDDAGGVYLLVTSVDELLEKLGER